MALNLDGEKTMRMGKDGDKFARYFEQADPG